MNIIVALYFDIEFKNSDINDSVIMKKDNFPYQWCEVTTSNKINRKFSKILAQYGYTN